MIILLFVRMMYDILLFQSIVMIRLSMVIMTTVTKGEFSS